MERSLAHLEEFLDTIVALPHDVQRLLTQLRTQEALTQQKEIQLNGTLQKIKEASAKKTDSASIKPLLEELQTRLTNLIGPSDEKVSIAQHLYKNVQHHVRLLEDEICAFEEEVRLARKYGELDEEEDNGDEDSDRKDDSEESPNNISNKRHKKSSTPQEPSTLPERNSVGSPRLSENASDFDTVPPLSSKAIKSKSESITSPILSPSASTATVEPTYCYCNQISFGEMVGCDNADCEIEWFHYGCVGLSEPPPDKWYCPDCTARLAKSISGEK